MNIEERLQNIICELCDFDARNIDFNEELDLEKDLGFSSIDFVQLIIEIEEKFNIVMEDMFLELSILKKYKKLIDIIKKMIEKQINHL